MRLLLVTILLLLLTVFVGSEPIDYTSFVDKLGGFRNVTEIGIFDSWESDWTLPEILEYDDQCKSKHKVEFSLSFFNVIQFQQSVN